MNSGPSKNLSWSELRCKDGTEYPQVWRDSRAIKLALMFETIRGCWNRPIKINSAYRSESWNRKIGGARFSQHVQGRALDMEPPNGIELDEFYKTILEFVDELGIRGIGLYKTFVHVDIRPSDKLIVWKGNGVKDSNN